MRNGNEMTMKHKTCHSLLKNYKISVEFATAIVKNFLPRRVGGSRRHGRGEGKVGSGRARQGLQCQEGQPKNFIFTTNWQT